jgi:hypothetical protein
MESPERLFVELEPITSTMGRDPLMTKGSINKNVKNRRGESTKDVDSGGQSHG